MCVGTSKGTSTYWFYDFPENRRSPVYDAIQESHPRKRLVQSFLYTLILYKTPIQTYRKHRSESMANTFLVVLTFILCLYLGTTAAIDPFRFELNRHQYKSSVFPSFAFKAPPRVSTILHPWGLPWAPGNFRPPRPNPSYVPAHQALNTPDVLWIRWRIFCDVGSHLYGIFNMNLGPNTESIKTDIPRSFTRHPTTWLSQPWT